MELPIPNIVLVSAFVVAVFYILPPITALLKAKTEEIRADAAPNSLPYWASEVGAVAVKAAEQLYTDNKAKKAYAVGVVTDYFIANGQPIIANIIDAIVESSVLELKLEKKEKLNAAENG